METKFSSDVTTYLLFKKRLAWVIGSFFGSGLFPKAPGTVGSLAAIPLCWWSLSFPDEVRFVFWICLFVIGVWGAMHMAEDLVQADPSSVVIDEVIGMGIATWTVSSWSSMAVAFCLFRFFDILKPTPIRILDRWSKKQTGWLNGFGILSDDVLAGIFALFILLALQMADLLE